MKFEFLIPASPTPEFFGQISTFRRGLDRIGGDYRSARVVAVFGDANVTEVSPEWEPHLSGVDVHWVPQAAFGKRSFAATGAMRFDLINSDADISILCDADTLLVSPFGPEVLDLVNENTVAGVIAHYHFRQPPPPETPTSDWVTLFRRIIGRDPKLEYTYSLAANGTIECPAYINLGFLAGSPKALKNLHTAMTSIERKVDLTIKSLFRVQVCLAMAIPLADVHFKSLPMRYNFPNDPRADRIYPTELQQAILFHYLRTDQFDRQKIFSSPTEYQKFLSSRLDGSNHRFQQHVRDIVGDSLPVTPAIR